MQWLLIEISAYRALKERRCTMEGEAQYVNIQGSVPWEGVYRVRECILEFKIFVVNYYN